jgi:tetratricopeptide (TPR) repeat protein
MAAQHLRRATDINPDFVPAYNQLGYALRFMEDFDGAEKTFQKYIELIPNEPNPYDSYAELLMKVGRFTESIEQYRKALEVNPNFVASYVGIGNNHIFMGEPEAARKAFAELEAVARTDGERRQACTWIAFSYLHKRDYDGALAEIERRYAIAAETDDFGAMAGDLNVIGDILLAAGKTDEAAGKYSAQLDMSARSNANDETKETVRRNHLADLARVALAQGDVAGATAKAGEYRSQVEQHQIPFEVWQSHELFGLIALEKGEYDAALVELEKANRMDARVMLAKARALEGGGDEEAGHAMCERAAHFNTLNQAPQSYALVRAEALEMLGG